MRSSTSGTVTPILMAQNLSRQLGLAVGISSGANILGAIQLKEEMGANANVVTILPDSNKKYLINGFYVGFEPVKDHYLSPGITSKMDSVQSDKGGVR